MIADLSKPGEIETFLTDFFDSRELEKYIKRIATVYWLKKGRTKQNIRTNLEVSPSNLVQAERLLKKEGVKLAIKKIESDEWANVWAEKIRRFGKK